MSAMNPEHDQSRSDGKKTGVWYRRKAPLSPVSITPHQFRAFKFCLTTIVTLSAAAACIENGLHPLLLLTLPVVVVALTRPDYSRPFLWSERATTVVFLIYAAAVSLAILLVHRRLPLPLLTVYFTFGTVMARVLTPLTDRHIAQLIFLTVGLVLINCILTNHMIFGLILPVYLFALMASLALFEGARSRQAASAGAEPFPEPKSQGLMRFFLKITVAIVIFSACAFVVLPRPYLMFPGLRAAMVRPDGMAEMQQRISYRDMVGMAGRDRIAFVVDLEEGKLPDYPYWRGKVLERFDGKGWGAGPERAGVPRFIQPDQSLMLVYRFTPYKLQSNTIYVAGLPLRILPANSRRSLFLSSNQEVIVDSPFLVANSYEVRSAKIPAPADRRQLPPNVADTGITPRIEKLARDWTSGATTPADKAQALISRFTSGFRYSLDVQPPPEGAHPMEYFLLQTRAGHCEYFAGAFCLMLRSLGIPARVVEGFAGMESTPVQGQYVIRFANAHAWVEAVLGNMEWTTLDPTPPASDLFAGRLWREVFDFYDRMVRRWIKYVVYFDRTDQAVLLETINEVLDGDISLQPEFIKGMGYVPHVLAVALVVLIGGLLVIYRFRRDRRDPVTVYTNTMKKLVERGALSEAHPWHELNSAELAERYPGSQAAAERFTDVYFRARFGQDRSVSPEDLAKAREELLDSVERARTI